MTCFERIKCKKLIKMVIKKEVFTAFKQIIKKREREKKNDEEKCWPASLCWRFGFNSIEKMKGRQSDVRSYGWEWMQQIACTKLMTDKRSVRWKFIDAIWEAVNLLNYDITLLTRQLVVYLWRERRKIN